MSTEWFKVGKIKTLCRTVLFLHAYTWFFLYHSSVSLSVVGEKNEELWRRVRLLRNLVPRVSALGSKMDKPRPQGLLDVQKEGLEDHGKRQTRTLCSGFSVILSVKSNSVNSNSPLTQKFDSNLLLYSNSIFKTSES